MTRLAIAIAAGLTLAAVTLPAQSEPPPASMSDRAREWVRGCVPYVLADEGPRDAVRRCREAAGMLFPGEVGR